MLFFINLTITEKTVIHLHVQRNKKEIVIHKKIKKRETENKTKQNKNHHSTTPLPWSRKNKYYDPSKRVACFQI